ncbi:MAG: hypothetical protein HY329_12860 [Chloroflexi bacterium]|nr:hypothetical protein [Chloroflexota bacterium]
MLKSLAGLSAGERAEVEALAQVKTLLASESWKRVLIEVETRNQNALGLYRSCGFREVTTYDFYRVPLAGLDSSP